MAKAFLIGAGATKAEYRKAPLSDNFFKLLKDNKKDLYASIKNTIERHTEKILIESNIEDVMKKSYEFDKSVRLSFLENLYSAIYELLAQTTESTEEDINNAIAGKPRTPATLFKTLLNDDRLNKNDFFMTLNYDLYLDREILFIQKNIDYGITDEYINIKRLKPLSSKPDFSVYHLHGSLNWEKVDGLDNKINISAGAIPPKFNRAGSNYCLVPPGMKELSPVLKSFWKIADERLLKADELIIIGCSLNQDDTELIKLIRNFIDKKGSEKIKIIKVIYKDSTDATFNYYKDIMGDRFIGYPYGFNINGPPDKSYTQGAIEFIFSDTNAPPYL